MAEVWAVPNGRYHRLPACARRSDGDIIPPRLSVEQAEAFGLKACTNCFRGHDQEAHS